MVESISIVVKGSQEFQEARRQYRKLFLESEKDVLIPRGIFEFGEHKGKCLGYTSKKISEANLPAPFGCPDLFMQPCEGGGIVWFCDRVGCICVCCREDFTGDKEKYPDYCPSRNEMYGDNFCDCGSSTCDVCNPGWDEGTLDDYEEDYW